MDKNFAQNHPVDNSALIHLALHNTWHTNCFRLVAHLKKSIQPAKLQKAVDALAPRFPMLAAGIRQKGKAFVVTPQTEHLYIRWDHEALAYMSMEEIRDCALRVLYGPRHIAIEVFHSLTDGNGALQFLKALLAEYLGTSAEPVSLDAAWEDSYQTHAEEKPTSMPGGASYLLPAAPEDEQKIYQTTLNFSVKELLAVTRAEHTTITAFFTALFAQTAMKQQQYEKEISGETLLPVQVMVPINLRKQFASDSLRNFSLYALPKLPPEAADAPFSEIVQSMAVQIQTQSAKSRLRAAIATNVALEQKTAHFPLWMKCAALRTGFEVCGGRSSCITVSNLGQVTLPDCIQQELERLDFMLTPRVHSPYNCGIVSQGDTLSLTITRRGEDRGVEKRFASLLVKQGIIPVVVEEEILQIAI